MQSDWNITNLVVHSWQTLLNLRGFRFMTSSIVPTTSIETIYISKICRIRLQKPGLSGRLEITSNYEVQMLESIKLTLKDLRPNHNLILNYIFEFEKKSHIQQMAEIFQPMKNWPWNWPIGNETSENEILAKTFDHSGDSLADSLGRRRTWLCRWDFSLITRRTHSLFGFLFKKKSW